MTFRGGAQISSERRAFIRLAVVMSCQKFMNWSPTVPEEDWSRVATCAADGRGCCIHSVLIVEISPRSAVSICCHLLSPVYTQHTT